MAGSIISCRISVANTALDTLFLIVIQALVVIALGMFIHLALRRHNLPSAISLIIVRTHQQSTFSSNIPRIGANSHF
jgi:hypothetical protein